MPACTNRKLLPLLGAPIHRVHLEAADVLRLFGQFSPAAEKTRQAGIHQFLEQNFRDVLSPSQTKRNPPRASSSSHPNTPLPCRLGFDIAASGQGDLAVLYIDQVKHSALWLQALLTARTEDWHFLKTAFVLFPPAPAPGPGRR